MSDASIMMHADATPVLSVENVTLEVAGPRGPVKILDDVSLDIRQGEFLGLLGESGSGKSMLARAIMRLYPDRFLRISGRISLDGRDLASASEAELRDLRGRAMAMIFQEPMTSLDPLMRVEDQIGQAIDAHRRVGKRERIEEIERLLADVQFANPSTIRRMYPHELSGGMRQRAMIAMALANTPKLLIADEPTTALDVTIQKEVLDIVAKLARERNLAVLFISHDLSLIHEYADRVAVIYGGVLMDRGPTREALSRPRHPYTAALLASLPGRRNEGRRHGIDGSVPSAENWFAGCRFAPRCTHAGDDCRVRPVGWKAISGEHEVRCLHPVEGAP